MDSFEKTLKELCENPKVLEVIEQNKLTNEQMIEALPILIDIDEESKNNKMRNNKYEISLYVSDEGNVRRKLVLSDKGKKENFRKNILSNDLEFINYDDDKEFWKVRSRQAIAKWMSLFLKKPSENPKGFYVYGEPGSGKTFLLKRFAKKLASMDYTVSILTVTNLSAKFKSTFSQKDNEKYEPIKQILLNCDYLFLDELGAEVITPWFRDDVLALVISQRLERNKPTFFASNYSIQQLEKLQSNNKDRTKDFEKSKRLMSRIKSSAEEFKIYKERK